MTQQGFVKLLGTAAIAALLVTSGAAIARDGQRQRGAQPQRVNQPHTRTTERQRTDNGHTRTDTVTRASDGATATRNAVVTNDKDAGTRTRNVDYTGFDGRQRSVDSTTVSRAARPQQMRRARPRRAI